MSIAIATLIYVNSKSVNLEIVVLSRLHAKLAITFISSEVNIPPLLVKYAFTAGPRPLVSYSKYILILLYFQIYPVIPYMETHDTIPQNVNLHIFFIIKYRNRNSKNLN